MAVKVQRPGVLEGISRDLFLLRIGAWLFEQIPMVQSDMVGLLDTWAIRFFDELDYVQEVCDECVFSLPLFYALKAQFNIVYSPVAQIDIKTRNGAPTTDDYVDYPYAPICSSSQPVRDSNGWRAITYALPTPARNFVIRLFETLRI